MTNMDTSVQKALLPGTHVYTNGYLDVSVPKDFLSGTHVPMDI